MFFSYVHTIYFIKLTNFNLLKNKIKNKNVKYKKIKSCCVIIETNFSIIRKTFLLKNIIFSLRINIFFWNILFAVTSFRAKKQDKKVTKKKKEEAG